MPSGCISFDDAGVIQFVNAPLCRWVDYEPEELLNQNIELLLTVSSRIFYRTRVYPLLRLNGKADEIFLSLKSKHGNSIPVLLYCIRSGSGEKITNLAVVVTVWERQKHEREISKAKKAQQHILDENQTLNRLKEELEQHQMQLDRQISMLTQRNQEYAQLNKVLSHDLQEPIRKIGLFAELLHQSEGISNYPEIVNYFQKIQKAIVRLRHLTQTLQQFVYPDSTEEIGTLAIEKLFHEAQAEAISAIGFSDFTLEIGEVPAFEGKSIQMKVVFTELLKNALQNRNPNHDLLIRIEAVMTEENTYQSTGEKYRYRDHLKLKVSDNGMGFDNRYHSYVFGLFNKLNPKSEGAGLGLALVKQIITHHYGTITVSSEEGKGTSFIITLPVVQPI